MRPGLFAFAAAAAFLGAALYVNFVEQPARLRLSAGSMVREWVPSNRRGFVMLSLLAVVSAIAAYVDSARTGDERWIIGGTVILASWPYVYFVVVPVNIWLCAIPAAAARSATRELMRDWGLLEWGQTAIGLGACCVFAWALALPA
jgi:anthrone oxygenase-like protein